jgi:hypothetical protein
MPHTSKKKRSSVGNNLVHPPARRSRRIAGRLNAEFDDLDDLLVNILEFLPIKEIMCNRRVSKKWGEMIMMVVPHGDFNVTNMNSYSRFPVEFDGDDNVMRGSFNTMRVMTTAMPNLQQISLGGFYGIERKYSDGEDPDPDLDPDDEWGTRTANYTTHDIEIISNFSKLRILDIWDAPFNGRYPFLFNSFPLLQKLAIKHCRFLKWDLGMLSAFPLLRDLYVSENNRLTGNVRCLRVLKDTLETLTISSCTNVEGNLMVLADFPLLKELDLYDTAVTGDVRDIGENNFSNLEKLLLPFGVVGSSGFAGRGYKFQRIADVPSVINAFYRLSKRAKPLFCKDPLNRPKPLFCEDQYWVLSAQSPDYYSAREESLVYPPHCVSFVKVGTRLGWRWTNLYFDGDDDDDDDDEREYHSCEINWLDPEPGREDVDYEAYVEELTSIQEEITVYRGYHQPPTEEEYMRLCREYAEN